MSTPNQDASRLYEENNIREFEQRLGLCFKNKSLLITALSHKSSIGDKLTSKEEMGRLAMLGDWLVDLLLFKVYYDRGYDREGMNDARRSTENKWLSVSADMLDVEPYLFLDTSFNRSVMDLSRARADSLEAVVGAIFIDGGYNEAQKFTDKWLIRYMLPVD